MNCRFPIEAAARGRAGLGQVAGQVFLDAAARPTEQFRPLGMLPCDLGMAEA